MKTSFGEVLDRMIERTLARIDDHAGERRIAEPANLTKVRGGRPKVHLAKPSKIDDK